MEGQVAGALHGYRDGDRPGGPEERAAGTPVVELHEIPYRPDGGEAADFAEAAAILPNVPRVGVLRAYL
ncbi:hypothetical protein Axi01nite_64950 [Actinoplanes xinjiangensis]|nr:hypothetical protein Axi01nite_64950 [Actinoplanes xinjiangensis]